MWAEKWPFPCGLLLVDSVSPFCIVKSNCPHYQITQFASVHASIHNHFSHQRHLNRRDIFKHDRATALAEWRQLAA